MATSTALASPRSRPRSSGLVLANSTDRARAFRRARVHSVLVRLLRLAMPATTLALIGYFALSLKLATTGIKGVTMSAPPTISAENLVMETPRHEGFTNDGGKFVVIAKTAKQDIKDRNAPVQLTGIDGKLT